MNEQPRTIAIHTSLIRPILLMGAERELVLGSAVLAATLVLSIERILFIVVGVVFWTFGVVALQRAAKADPHLSRVYLRHARYRAYYAAQSRVTARVPSAREGMPC